ncbi:small ribosomal subunit protein eS19A [Cydia pomonella]|uniref:small ribosomal subunit protein eS19A n=1 Tax=Cydia pomonella TaxID=82600 RepID=UPI002ADE3C0F|nr:small ribosomal subunit protein eS19A [Cydia pomonella]
MRSVTLKDVKQDKVVKIVTAHLKTGKVKVLEHTYPDWFYVRCAAILRHIYIPVGVKTVTRILGGHKRNGVTPSASADCPAASPARRSRPWQP